MNDTRTSSHAGDAGGPGPGRPIGGRAALAAGVAGAAAAPPGAAAAGPSPVQSASILPNATGGSSFLFTGFVKADGMWTDTPDGEIADSSVGRDFYVPGAIPVGGLDEGTDFNAHVKQTRLGLGVDTPIGGKDRLQARVEVDLFGSSLGSQRTTNTYGVISAENPETSSTPFRGGTQIQTDDSSIPDFTARSIRRCRSSTSARSSGPRPANSRAGRRATSGACSSRPSTRSEARRVRHGHVPREAVPVHAITEDLRAGHGAAMAAVRRSASATSTVDWDAVISSSPASTSRRRSTRSRSASRSCSARPACRTS